ncbi:MAG: hypothetical protein EOM14_16740, partial [Clostridia bacterium]|nr:hypothetical protein [Clostridia bacterium]
RLHRTRSQGAAPGRRESGRAGGEAPGEGGVLRPGREGRLARRPGRQGCGLGTDRSRREHGRETGPGGPQRGGEGRRASTVEGTGGTSPYTYLWSDNQTTATATNLAAGTYTVTVTDANGCQAQGFVEITEPTQLIAEITFSSDVSCFGGSDGTATVNATGGTTGYTYLWNTTPAQTTATATGLAVGTYTVTHGSEEKIYLDFADILEDAENNATLMFGDGASTVDLGFRRLVFNTDKNFTLEGRISSASISSVILLGGSGNLTLADAKVHNRLWGDVIQHAGTGTLSLQGEETELSAFIGSLIVNNRSGEVFVTDGTYNSMARNIVNTAEGTITLDGGNFRNTGFTNTVYNTGEGTVN